MASASERVADGEVECQGVFERRHVVVAAPAGVVGCVYAHSEVGPHHEYAYVKAQTGACAECEVA